MTRLNFDAEHPPKFVPLRDRAEGFAIFTDGYWMQVSNNSGRGQDTVHLPKPVALKLARAILDEWGWEQ